MLEIVLCYFKQKGSPKKRSPHVPLSPIVIFTIIGTECKWRVQTNWPDFAGHKRSADGDYTIKFPTFKHLLLTHTKIPGMSRKNLTYGSPMQWSFALYDL